MNALALLAAALLLPAPAFAHVGDALHHGLMAGFLHPFSGADHLLAMLTVGLWAGLSGGAARLALPVAFIGGMVVGGGLGIAGLMLPGMETGILASVIVLGVLAALVARLPLAVGSALVAACGLLHGAAHGVELGAAAMPGAIGGTAVLLGAGLAFGTAAAPSARLAGGATAAVGLLLALG